MQSDYRVKEIFTDEETGDVIARCYDVLYGEEFEKFIGQGDDFFGKENASSLLQDSNYEMSDEIRQDLIDIFNIVEFEDDQDYDSYQFYDFGDDDFEDEEDELEYATVGVKESFNLREALNKIDLDTYNKYDLLNLYEACDLKENEKRALANIVYDQNDPSVIYDTLNNRFVGGKEIEMPERVKDGVIHEDDMREGFTYNDTGTDVEVYSDYYIAKSRANELGLKLAEYGDLDNKYSYCYWNESGNRNDDEQVLAYYKFVDTVPAPLDEFERQLMIDRYEKGPFDNEINESKSIKENIGNKTFSQWFDETNKGKYDKEWEPKYYPFTNYIKTFPNAEVLKDATAEDIKNNAHRFYDIYDVDSVDREKAFHFASEELGIDYDDFYYAWIKDQPMKGVNESVDEFEFDDEFNAYYDGYTEEDKDENSAFNKLKNNVDESIDDSKYITDEIASKTNSQEIKDAIDKNNLSVLVRDNTWYTEKCPNGLGKALKDEMKRLYPDLKHMYGESKSIKEDKMTDWDSTDSLGDDMDDKRIGYTVVVFEKKGGYGKTIGTYDNEKEAKEVVDSEYPNAESVVIRKEEARGRFSSPFLKRDNGQWQRYSNKEWVNESVNEEEPYTKEMIEADLKSITHNFTDKEGELKCGFEEEKNFGVEILKQHYQVVETSGDDRRDGTWYHISYAEPLHSPLKEGVDEKVVEMFKDSLMSIQKEDDSKVVDVTNTFIQNTPDNLLSELLTFISDNFKNIELNDATKQKCSKEFDLKDTTIDTIGTLFDAIDIFTVAEKHPKELKEYLSIVLTIISVLEPSGVLKVAVFIFKLLPDKVVAKILQLINLTQFHSILIHLGKKGMDKLRNKNDDSIDELFNFSIGSPKIAVEEFEPDIDEGDEELDELFDFSIGSPSISIKK